MLIIFYFNPPELTIGESIGPIQYYILMLHLI